MSVTESIREAMAGLTSKQKSIAQYIMDNPDEASYLSLKELSVRTGSSEVSVLRLCRALGYDNFVALKDALKQHTQGAFRAATLSAPSLHPDNRIGTAEELLNKVCADEQNNLNATIAQLDAEMLVNCAHRLLESERVFVFAHDRSYVFADYLCYRLNFLRIQATAVQLGESNTVSTILAAMQEGDTAILFSFPPYYEPCANTASYCRYKNIPLIAVTDSMDSPAAAGADSVFLCRTGARYFYNSQVATLSFINILTSCIAIQMGSGFDEILANEQDVMDFLDSFNYAEKAEN